MRAGSGLRQIVLVLLFNRKDFCGPVYLNKLPAAELVCLGVQPQGLKSLGPVWPRFQLLPT